MDIERLKALRTLVSGYYTEFDVGMNTYVTEAVGKELLNLIDEAIARQSATSEEVAEAIEWHKNCLQYYKDEDKEIRSHYGGNLPSWVVESIKASDVSIKALQAYEPKGE